MFGNGVRIGTVIIVLQLKPAPHDPDKLRCYDEVIIVLQLKPTPQGLLRVFTVCIVVAAGTTTL